MNTASIKTMFKSDRRPTRTGKVAVESRSMPEIPIQTAEKTLRDIAKRNGEAVRKRRSSFLKQQMGGGYCVSDRNSNLILSGASTHDGCDLSLEDLADWYKDDKNNTSWQRTVVNAILNNSINES
jgi:hypothetical protein